MPLTAARYKSTVRSRVRLGANFRKMRYQGTELSLMPNMNSLGEGERDRQEVNGLFFEQWRAWLGVFEQIENSLPAEAFKLGANWEMSEGNGATWFGAFILKPPIRQPQWYECIFARFIADANLTVNYEQGLSTYSTVEGNRVENTTPAQFTAVVSQQQRPSDLDLPGTPAAAIYLEGYHSNPQIAPTVNKQQKLSATLNGVSGEFVMLPTVQPPAGGNAGTGDVLKGLFLVKGL